MSLAVCAYVLLLTTLVASAAAAIEWGAQGRIPVRHLWSIAILLAFLTPPAALAWHAASRKVVAARNEATSNRVTSVALSAGPAPIRHATTVVSHSPRVRVLLAHKPRWSTLATGISTRLTPIVVPLWICASAAFIAWLLIGALHWRRARRGWRSAVMDGVQVEISPATGPAVLGVISHRIVMPAWAMSMPSEQRKLMLAHECEHVSARDPERLALAVVALVLMPWNAVLWWCAARLRRAIELDCDARVLRRYPGAKEYGHLLLDVASRSQEFRSIRTPSMALLHVSSELELRVRAMMQPRCAARRAIVVGAGITVVAVAAAFTTPVPELSMLRSNVSKRDSVVVPQSAVVLHHVTVKVGRSLVTFDSATYSPKMHTISAGPSMISRLYLASGATDTTIEGTRDIIISLRRKADSLRLLSAQLAARKHELDDVRARLNSTQRVLRVTNAQLKSISVGVIAGSSKGNYNEFARRMNAERVLRERYLPSAIDKNYPGIARSVKPGMLLWFVVDSSGRVIRTTRDETFNRSIPFSAERVAERFPGIASHDIISTSVAPKVIGNATATIVWAVDGKP